MAQPEESNFTDLEKINVNIDSISDLSHVIISLILNILLPTHDEIVEIIEVVWLIKFIVLIMLAIQCSNPSTIHFAAKVWLVSRLRTSTTKLSLLIFAPVEAKLFQWSRLVAIMLLCFLRTHETNSAATNTTLFRRHNSFNELCRRTKFVAAVLWWIQKWKFHFWIHPLLAEAERMHLVHTVHHSFRFHREWVQHTE